MSRLTASCAVPANGISWCRYVVHRCVHATVMCDGLPGGASFRVVVCGSEVQLDHDCSLDVIAALVMSLVM